MSAEASAAASAGCCCDVPLCTFPQGLYRLRISCSASRVCREFMLNGLLSETIETSSVDFIADMVGGFGYAASPLSASYTRSFLLGVVCHSEQRRIVTLATKDGA